MNMKYNSEAERAVLGSIILEPEQVWELCEENEVRSESFHEPKHRILFLALEDMVLNSKPIDLFTVGETLKEAGSLDRIGGYEAIEAIIDGTHTTAHAQYYIEILKDTQLRREITTTAQDVISKSEDSDDTDGLLTDFQDKVLGLGQKKKETLTVGQYAEAYEQKCIDGAVGHLPHFCDRWTSRFGLLSNEIVICHAPRSTGKTSFLKQWHLHLKRRGHDVPFFSLETPAERLVSRYLAEVGQVNMLKMGNPHMQPPPYHPDWERLSNATKEIDSLELTIFDGNWDIERIRTKARQLVNQGAQAIMIDNLICIKTRKNFDGQQQKYMYLLDKFREIREDINKPIILLAHPNADGNVKWAGELEDLADVVIYLFDINKMTERKNMNNLHEILGIERRVLPELHSHVIANWQKNRDGETPKMELDFDLEWQTFSPIGGNT